MSTYVRVLMMTVLHALAREPGLVGRLGRQAKPTAQVPPLVRRLAIS